MIANTQKEQKTHSFPQFLQFYSLRPTHIIVKAQKVHPTPKPNFFPFFPPALRSTSLTRPHSFARTHARTHDTNTKRNRNRFPDWVQLMLNSPQSPTRNLDHVPEPSAVCDNADTESPPVRRHSTIKRSHVLWSSATTASRTKPWLQHSLAMAEPQPWQRPRPQSLNAATARARKESFNSLPI